MATKLNKRAFEYAQERITEGRVVLDDRDPEQDSTSTMTSKTLPHTCTG
jgi:hypothetical protein